MKERIKVIGIIGAMGCLLINPGISIRGASYGLMLWYRSVLPVLLPFFIISGLLQGYLHGFLLKKPQYLVLFSIILGNLCGYPCGAKLISNLATQKAINEKQINAYMLIANQASPMFLIGYVYYEKMQSGFPFWVFVVSLYGPYFLFGCIYLKINWNRTFKTNVLNSLPNKTTSLDQCVSDSLVLIAKIGCYIMLYSILCSFLLQLSLSPFAQYTVVGLLEMTTGISYIADLSINELTKTALIIAIASFGGCSSISQTKCVIQQKGLSLKIYCIGKLLFGISSLVVYYLLMLVV